MPQRRCQPCANCHRKCDLQSPCGTCVTKGRENDCIYPVSITNQATVNSDGARSSAPTAVEGVEGVRLSSVNTAGANTREAEEGTEDKTKEDIDPHNETDRPERHSPSVLLLPIHPIKLSIFINPSFRGLLHPVHRAVEQLYILSTTHPAYDRSIDIPRRIIISPATPSEPVTRSDWTHYPNFSAAFSLSNSNASNPPYSRGDASSGSVAYAATLMASSGRIFVTNALAVAVHRAALAMGPRTDDGKFTITVELRSDPNTTMIVFDADFGLTTDSPVTFESIKVHNSMQMDRTSVENGMRRHREMVDAAMERLNALAQTPVSRYWSAHRRV